MAKTSQEALDRASQGYYFSAQQTGIDNRMRERMIRRCLKHLAKDQVLELGIMDGQWTDHFLALGCEVTAVEGARRQFDYASQKYANEPRVRLVYSLFEDYEPEQKYDTILMGGMLKHLPEPDVLLRRSTGWLKPGGILIATTPNPLSLHRRVGTYMGMLPSPEALTEADQKVGNLRHYTREEWAELLTGNGYRIRELKTSSFRVVSGDKMQNWDDALLDALDQVAEELPEYGWYIYAICEVDR